jgi:hypothetical protein
LILGEFFQLHQEIDKPHADGDINSADHQNRMGNVHRNDVVNDDARKECPPNGVCQRDEFSVEWVEARVKTITPIRTRSMPAVLMNKAWFPPLAAKSRLYCFIRGYPRIVAARRRY